MPELRSPEGLSYLDFQHTSILYALKRRRTLIADQPGLGKGHPVTSRIMTTKGYTFVSDLEIGDYTFDSTGKAVRISNIHERGMLSIYKITTSDGRETLVDGDHIWTVFDPQVEDFINLSTTEVAGTIDKNWILPTLQSPIELPWREYELSPTAAGVLMVNPEAFSEDIYVDPVDYELGDPAQRIEFLSGIIRSHGRVRGDDNHMRLYMYKPHERTREIDSIIQVVRSIGGVAYTSKKLHCMHLDIYLPHDIWRKVVGYFNDNGKYMAKRWQNFVPGVPEVYIKSIEPFGQDNVRCISVEGPESLYVTDQYILTHNTVSALGVGNNLRSVNSMLIICLASHKIHWKRAVEKWDMHGLSVDIAEGDFFPDTECVVINYDILHRHYDAIRAGTWSLLVCDEAHVLQNPEARRTLNVFGGKKRTREAYEFRGKKKFKNVWEKFEEIKAEREVYLTGTPIPNRVKNMWTIIKRCDPRGLGRNYEAFTDQYCGAYETFMGRDDNGASNLDELREILRDRFMVRHLKEMVLKDLPPKVRQIVPLSSKGLQKKLQAEKDAVSELLIAYEEKMGIHKDMDEESLAELVMNAKPQMFDDYADTVEDTIGKDTPLNKLAIARAELALEKVPMIVEHVQSLIDQGEKVVIFAYHRAVIEALKERWDNSCACIYGGTPTKKRQAEADRFQEDENCNPFIGQFTAAGTGYTLTAARFFVGSEMTWLPHEMSQAEDRLHRIGQEDTVYVHHLVVEGSMDEGMLGKIVAKQKIIDQALDGITEEEEIEKSINT